MINLVERLRQLAEVRPEDTACVFRQDGDQGGVVRTYAQLDRRARALGAVFQQAGMTGKPILLSMPPGLDFIDAFMGCLYAGALAVPTGEPRRGGKARGRDHLAGIARDTGATLALTTDARLSLAQHQASQRAELEVVSWFAGDSVPDDLAEEWKARRPAADEIAFLQYTSGTTSTPRGVMVSHTNLVANLRAIEECFGHDTDSVGVIWLPHYHDMGLIGGILQPLFTGFPVTLMSPQGVLRKPLRWLQMISETGATVSGGPNFAYDLCTQRISPDEAAGLDLSRWQLAFTGAETVHVDTLDRFAEAFAVSGFDRRAFYPVYGLAEATLLVTGGQRGRHPMVHEVGETPLVGCGEAAPGLRVCIVDPETGSEVAPGEVGEIWVSGPSVTRGYWKRADETRRAFGNHLSTDPEVPFLATGDLGLMVDGQVFITGRLKDLIIIRGQNHYPQDIERTVELAVPELGRATTVAFAIESEATETLALVCEVERTRRHDLDVADVIRRIRGVVGEDHELAAQDVVLVRPGSVPRTTSGKIQRGACREAFLRGTLKTVAVSNGTTAPSPQPKPVPGVGLERQAVRALDPEARTHEIEVYLLSRMAAMRPGSGEVVLADQPLAAAGFDSLTVAELLARAQADLEVDVDMESLGAGGTIRQLAGELSRQLGLERPSARPPRSTSRELPLTPAQHDLLSPQYENPAGFVAEVFLRLPAGVEPGALEATLRDVARRHDALAMTFVPGSDGFRQIERGDVVDWRYMAAHDLDAGALRNLSARLTHEATATMDLAKGPLLRATLIDRGPDRSGLLRLDASHLLVDRISLMVLFADLEAAWTHPEREPTDLRQPAVTYRRWVEALAERAASAEVEAELDYWIESCRDVDDVQVGGPGPHGVGAGTLDEETSVRLAKRYPTAQAQHDLFLAALAWSWTRQSGQRNVLVDLEGHGRHAIDDVPAPTRTVGWLTDHYPLRVRVDSGQERTTFVSETAAAVAGVPGHGKGFGLLAHLSSDPSIRLRCEALPRPMLALTFAPRSAEWFRSESVFPVIHSGVLLQHRWTAARRGWGIRLSAGTQGNRFFWKVLYDPERVDHATAIALSGSVLDFLKSEADG